MIDKYVCLLLCLQICCFVCLTCHVEVRLMDRTCTEREVGTVEYIQSENKDGVSGGIKVEVGGGVMR